MVLLSINFVLLTMLKVRENKYTLGSVGVFQQQGPCTWSLPCLYEQVHFEQNMNEFYNSQTVKNLDLRAQTHWRYWTLRQSLPWDARGRNYWCNPVVEVTTQRGNLGRPVIPISIGMVDFSKALYDFGSSVNIIPRGGHSWTPRERSSTLVLPRSVSTSKGGRRRFPSRTRLHKSQSNPDMNQGTGSTGGTGTSKCRLSQLRWSLQLKEVKIINSSRLSSSRRMTLVFQASSAQSTDILFIRHSTTPDLTST